MRKNKVKEALQAGKTTLGTMIFEFNTTGIAPLVAAAGAEFIIFDMEHTGWGIDTIRTLLATTRGLDIVPMVRVPDTQYHLLANALDVGAVGLMIPMVETGEQAQFIAESVKYPPQGRRGAAFGIAHDNFGLETGGNAEKSQQANDEGLIIAQIETAKGIENVEAIAAIDGIDVLWIGHNDLTNSMGIPGQFEHPDYLAAVKRVLAAAKQHGKYAGMMPMTVEQACSYLDQGFQILAYGGDLWLYQQTMRDGLAAIRAHQR